MTRCSRVRRADLQRQRAAGTSERRRAEHAALEQHRASAELATQRPPGASAGARRGPGAGPRPGAPPTPAAPAGDSARPVARQVAARQSGAFEPAGSVGALRWGYSSAGRASGWQPEGQRFEPAYLHQLPLFVCPRAPPRPSPSPLASRGAFPASARECRRRARDPRRGDSAPAPCSLPTAPIHSRRDQAGTPRSRSPSLVFLAGIGSMATEICASRLLAPYYGSSTVVWANIIGLILASLSVGYWLGGRLADRRPSPHLLATIVLVAAALGGRDPLRGAAVPRPLHQGHRHALHRRGRRLLRRLAGAVRAAGRPARAW